MILNKHGQTLILFIILIPLILGLLAFTIDLGVVITNKSHIKEVTKTIIKENIDLMDQEKIKSLMLKNDIDTKNLKIEINDNVLRIINTVEIESIFGKIIGINNYRIKIDIKGYKEEEKIILEY